MDIDRILMTFNEHQVKYLVIGGVNFMLRHQPNLTYDVDLWVESSLANRTACETALAALDAEWGKTDETWRKVAEHSPGWLDAEQSVYCLASPSGAVDIFFSVKGLGEWSSSYNHSVEVCTSTGSLCRGLNDEEMLACQLALSPAERKQSRIDYLEQRRQDP